jgi:hypothetical protein
MSASSITGTSSITRIDGPFAVGAAAAATARVADKNILRLIRAIVTPPSFALLKLAVDNLHAWQ